MEMELKVGALFMDLIQTHSSLLQQPNQFRTLVFTGVCFDLGVVCVHSNRGDSTNINSLSNTAYTLTYIRVSKAH